MTLVEGAASGRPLITTDTPGCEEIVTRGENGFLVLPRDAAAVAHAIRQLQDDPALVRGMGRASRAKALREFEETLVFEMTVSVYAEILADFDAPGVRRG